MAAVVGALVVGAAFVGLGKLSLGPFSTSSESRNTQVVRSIERQEKVVLLALGIQGIAEENVKTSLFGVDVPGSARALFLQYEYQAMLGVDGSRVKITQVGEKAYRVSIPEFTFIGHNDAAFKTAVEQNGVLSWVSPKIDTAAVITKILNDDTKKKHLADNNKLLREQAEAFYGGILHGVDPELRLTFEYLAP